MGKKRRRPQNNKIRVAGREPRVRELAAQGKTSREIAAALKLDGLHVSHAAVARFLREETDERRELARSVAASDAQTSVALVTAALRESLQSCLEGVRAARKGARWDQLARVTHALTHAARALHGVTTGGETVSGEGLGDEVAAIIVRTG